LNGSDTSKSHSSLPKEEEEPTTVDKKGRAAKSLQMGYF
jgi:hypothetical protein